MSYSFTQFSTLAKAYTKTAREPSIHTYNGALYNHPFTEWVIVCSVNWTSGWKFFFLPFQSRISPVIGSPLYLLILFKMLQWNKTPTVDAMGSFELLLDEELAAQEGHGSGGRKSASKWKWTTSWRSQTIFFSKWQPCHFPVMVICFVYVIRSSFLNPTLRLNSWDVTSFCMQLGNKEDR